MTESRTAASSTGPLVGAIALELAEILLDATTRVVTTATLPLGRLALWPTFAFATTRGEEEQDAIAIIVSIQLGGRSPSRGRTGISNSFKHKASTHTHQSLGLPRSPGQRARSVASDSLHPKMLYRFTLSILMAFAAQAKANIVTTEFNVSQVPTDVTVNTTFPPFANLGGPVRHKPPAHPPPTTRSPTHALAPRPTSRAPCTNKNPDTSG